MHALAWSTLPAMRSARRNARACMCVCAYAHAHAHACMHAVAGLKALESPPPSLCCVAAGVRVGVGPTLGLAAFVLALRSLPADAMRSCLFLRALQHGPRLAASSCFFQLRSCWLLVRDPREPCAACLRWCALPCLLLPTGIELLLLAPSLSLRGLCRPSLALRASSCMVRCVCGASILVLLVQQPRGGFPCTPFLCNLWPGCWTPALALANGHTDMMHMSVSSVHA